MTLQEGMQELLKVVYMVAFVYGVILVMEGGYKLKNGDVADAKMGIISALLLTAGPFIIEALFLSFGLPGVFNI